MIGIPRNRRCWPKQVRDLNDDDRLYMITCAVNGRRYVGVTERRVEERLEAHLFHAHDPRSRQNPLHKDMVLYGASCFHVKQLDASGSSRTARIIEKELISKYKTLVEFGGYNVNLGCGGPGVRRVANYYLYLYRQGLVKSVFRYENAASPKILEAIKKSICTHKPPVRKIPGYWIKSTYQPGTTANPADQPTSLGGELTEAQSEIKRRRLWE